MNSQTTELPDEAELEAWRRAADTLLRGGCNAHDLRSAALLLQNAYMFGRAALEQAQRVAQPKPVGIIDSDGEMWFYNVPGGKRSTLPAGTLLYTATPSHGIDAAVDAAMKAVSGVGTSPIQQARAELEEMLSHGSADDALEAAVHAAAIEHNPPTEGRQAPIVVNLKSPGRLALGDYVFASRWDDCDPADPWCVGHVAEISPTTVRLHESPRFWPYAMKITSDQGRRICEQYPNMGDMPLDFEAISSVFGKEPA